MKKLNSMVIEIMFVIYLNPNSNYYMRGTTLTSYDLGLRGSESFSSCYYVALARGRVPIGTFPPFRWTSVSLISSKI